MRVGGSNEGWPRHLPSSPDAGNDLQELPRAIAMVALGGAPMLALAGLARLGLVEAAAMPLWLTLGILALAALAYFGAMVRATGLRVLAAVLAIGLPLVLYYFSSRGGPGIVIAPFALVTMWIVSIIAAVSFANLGGSQ